MKTGTKTKSLFDEPDLFDLLAADEEPDAIHCILSNMAIACGRGLLDLTRAMQNRQAPEAD